MDIYYIIINILQCIKKLKLNEMNIYYIVINFIDTEEASVKLYFRNCSINYIKLKL